MSPRCRLRLRAGSVSVRSSSSDQWLYELKLDGYRAIAFKRQAPPTSGRGTTRTSTGMDIVPERFRQGYDQSAALRSYNDRTDVRTLNVSRARHPPRPL